MTYQHAAEMVAPFAPKIGRRRMVHVDNARPLLGPSVFERMMLHFSTRQPRHGFVEPADVITWLVISDVERSCQGR